MCLGVGGGISSGRVYVHVVKFIGGGERGVYVHVAKFMGDYVHVYKFEQGGGGCCPGGY